MGKVNFFFKSHCSWNITSKTGFPDAVAVKEPGKAVLIVLIPIVFCSIISGLRSAVIIAFMNATTSLIPKF